MGAYSLVNNQIRKKLDEMLKTWKEPVPGSLDTRPVFPVNITRNIENALIKARTAAVQQQQKQARSQQQILGRSQPLPGAPWQQTPTPPQSALRYPPPSSQNYGHPQIPNGNIQVQGVVPDILQIPLTILADTVSISFTFPIPYSPTESATVSGAFPAAESTPSFTAVHPGLWSVPSQREFRLLESGH